MSNHPETLPNANTQLYKCEIPLTAETSQRIRVIIWHLAESSEFTFHLALKLGAGTGSVTNFEGHVQVSGNYSEAGLCCAQAVLYGLYGTNYNNADLSTSEVNIFNHTITSGCVLGAVLQFDVLAHSSTTLYLRTFVGSVDESVPPDENSTIRDIRGWWPYSEATFVVAGNVDTNPLATSDNYIWCPIEEVRDADGNEIEPPELKPAVFGHRDSDTWGWPKPNLPPDKTPPSPPRGGDVGLYGAIVKYVFTASNTDTANQHAAYLSIYARNNGGYVSGAAQIITPSGYPQWVVPQISWIDHTSFAEGRALTEKPSGTYPVLVPANTSSQTVIVRFTAAGASSLPGNLYFYSLRESGG